MCVCVCVKGLDLSNDTHARLSLPFSREEKVWVWSGQRSLFSKLRLRGCYSQDGPLAAAAAAEI